MYVDIKL